MDFKNRIPVTLVSGWHGSGKTTLLTQLAKAQEEDKGQRVGVGSMEMIRMREGDDMLDELRRDIERVVSSGLCKSLVVECGGLHQPMRVADMLRMTGLNDRVALDTCVTVVDATTMMQNMYVVLCIALLSFVFCASFHHVVIEQDDMMCIFVLLPAERMLR